MPPPALSCRARKRPTPEQTACRQTGSRKSPRRRGWKGHRPARRGHRIPSPRSACSFPRSHPSWPTPRSWRARARRGGSSARREHRYSRRCRWDRPCRHPSTRTNPARWHPWECAGNGIRPRWRGSRIGFYNDPWIERDRKPTPGTAAHGRSSSGIDEGSRPSAGRRGRSSQFAARPSTPGPDRGESGCRRS